MNFNLTIQFLDEDKPNLVFLDITEIEVIAMVDLHLKEMAVCQIERVNEVAE